MRFTASVLAIGVGLLSSTCLGGCLKPYSFRDVTVAVHDAETGRPIPHAQIGVDYRYMMVLNAPKPNSCKTGDDGLAVIRAANFDVQVWTVSASDYLPDERYGIHEQENLNFRLYREPAPKVTIIISNGFRGPLLIEWRQSAEKIRDKPGPRRFTFHASHQGYVLIDATPLLMRVSRTNFTAAYENERPIQNAGPRTGSYEVALREVAGV